MKISTKTLIATATLALAGTAAYAQEATAHTTDFGVTPAQMQMDTTTRAQVESEAMMAKMNGDTAKFSAGYLPKPSATEPRSEVVAETREAARTGEIEAIDGEVPSYDVIAMGGTYDTLDAPRTLAFSEY